MIHVEIPALNKQIKIERIIGAIKGTNQTPTLIFIAGIHGNETSGVYAIQKVIKSIKNNNIKVRGNIYAISGNLNALKKGKRFEKEDLNRIWTHQKIKALNNGVVNYPAEVAEQKSIYTLVKNIVASEKGPFYFIDLHSTSAQTTPFITISDSINNRKFSKQFPVPIVLGIEEYLDGTFLSFINEFGHVSLGFESGQHTEIQSIKCSEAFIWLSLVNAGCIHKTNIKQFKKQKQLLANLSSLKGNFFEIDFRHLIQPKDIFEMQPNFNNFDTVSANQLLATHNSKPVLAPLKGKIFMPLYQKQGDDGFFIVTKISKFWLELSKFLRRIHFYYFLRLLPGIRQYSSDKNVLIVNHKTAKFLATEIFHLVGYRKKIIKNGQWLFIKRDKKIKPLL